VVELFHFNKKATISQDTIIGEAEKLVNEPKMLIEFEDMTEINNFDQVRRLKAQEKSNLLHLINKILFFIGISHGHPTRRLFYRFSISSVNVVFY
jgi:hypothetical protein